MKKILFIDRDGTLIVEPSDKQVDSLEKLQFLPNVIPALLELKKAGFLFVMVTNQDGLGTPSLPENKFRVAQDKMLQILESQGIVFQEILICPHRSEDRCLCRKPQIGLVRKYITGGTLDLQHSAVIGDRVTDVQLGENMGLRGYRLGELSWPEVTRLILSRPRVGKSSRATKETQIQIEVDLDGSGESEISTGIGFFDHMLDQFSKHGGVDLKIRVKGDLEVDEHHVVEDTALALGEALRSALGDKTGISRYGFTVPMDEALAQVSVDLSGRSFLSFKGAFPRDGVGALPTELVPHFFRSLADAMGMTIHISVEGENTHHMIESVFKATARALKMAFSKTGEASVPSTKGVL